MIPWIGMRRNPLALLPHLGVLVAAGVIFIHIFTSNELGTGRDIGHILVVVALIQAALALDLFLQAAVAHRIWSDELDLYTGRVLRMARRAQWILLVAPALTIVLVTRWPPTPQALVRFAPATIFAWALLLLNAIPISAGYLLLAVLNPLNNPLVKEQMAQDSSGQSAVNPDHPALEIDSPTP
jgi:hypothetical protein